MQQVELEGRLVSSLGSAGRFAAAAVPRVDGSYATAVTVAGEVFAGLLAEDAPGNSVERPSVLQAKQLGTALATLHRQGDSKLAKQRLVIDMRHLAHGPLERLRRAVPSHWYSAEKLEAKVSELAELAWPSDELPAGFCHGDVHCGNIHYDGSAPCLFDFGEVGYGPSCYDLACYWRKRRLSEAEPEVWTAEWEAILAGYGDVRPLSPEELRAIPALGVLRALWTMAMPTLPGCASWGGEWIRSPEYFRAHLKMIDRLAGHVSA